MGSMFLLSTNSREQISAKKNLIQAGIQTRSFFITGPVLYRFATITAIFIEGIGSKLVIG